MTADFSRADVYAIDEFAGATRTTPGTNSDFYRAARATSACARCTARTRRRRSPRPTSARSRTRSGAPAASTCACSASASTGTSPSTSPGSARDSRARVVDLTPASREAHAATFGSLAAVPTQGMTLGVADLLEAKRIVVLATGAAKAAIVREAIEGPQTADVPASWLQIHGDVAWVLDEAAARANCARRAIAGLYVIIDPDACRGRSPIDIARAALEGGAAVDPVARQAPQRARPGRRCARDLRALPRSTARSSIVNDYPDLARRCGRRRRASRPGRCRDRRMCGRSSAAG